MIARLATEGQYRLADDVRARLNELDNEAVAAVEAGDRDTFADLLARMHDLVVAEGEPLPGDELVGSDVIIPPPDSTLDEARADFSGDGLIPD